MVKNIGYVPGMKPIPGTSGRPAGNLPKVLAEAGAEVANRGNNHMGCAEIDTIAKTIEQGGDPRLLHNDPFWVKGRAVTANGGKPVPAELCPTCADVADTLGISPSVTDSKSLSPTFKKFAVGQ